MALQWVFLALTQTRPHHSTTDPANMYQESMCVLSTLQCASTKGWGWWRLGAVMDYERQRGPDLRLHLSRARETNMSTCTGSASERAQNSVYSQQEQRVNTGPTCFRTPPFCCTSPSSGKGENIYFKETENPKPKLRASALATCLDPIPIRVLMVTERIGSLASQAPPALVVPSPASLLARWYLLTYPKERFNLHSCQIQLSHLKYWAHPDCTGAPI